MRWARGMVVVVLLALLVQGCALASALLGGRSQDGVNDPTGPVELPSPAITLSPPTYPRIAGWGVGPDGLVLRVEVDDTLPGGGRYTFGADGSVVRVADSTVFMSRADLTTWRLTRPELRSFLRRLEAAGVRSEVPGDPEPAWGPSVQIGYWTNGVERIFETRASGAMAIAREMTSRPAAGVRRWVPHDIGFLAGRPDHTARSPLGPRDPFAPWPLATGVRELANGTLPNSYREQKLAICLRGRAARRAWTLFTGVNTAWLRVDDGRRWELQSFVTLPGYRVLGGPCLGTAPN